MVEVLYFGVEVQIEWKVGAADCSEVVDFSQDVYLRVLILLYHAV